MNCHNEIVKLTFQALAIFQWEQSHFVLTDKGPSIETLACLTCYQLQVERKYSIGHIHDQGCLQLKAAFSGFVHYESCSWIWFPGQMQEEIFWERVKAPFFVNTFSMGHMLNNKILCLTHDDLNIVDSSSMQDSCHIWTQVNDLVFHELS